MKLMIGTEDYLRAAACYIRYQVFVLERSITAQDEFDTNDIPTTLYAIVFDGTRPASTARLLIEDEETVRITRVATLSDYRGQQLGSQVVTGLEAYAKEHRYKQVIIHAELDALNFYLKLGYHTISDIYYEDGEPCQSVSKTIE